jgi:hypothetical protein
VIYFLQSIEGGPIKIGFTDNLDVRWKQLESHYGCQLALLASLPGGREEEAEIHEQFKCIRLGRTEQFRPASELMAFIGRPLLVSASPDVVEAMVSRPEPLIAVKCRKEFKDWVSEFARKLRTTPSQLIDRALAKLAENERFKEPPAR